MARPSLFNEAIADEICERIADGDSLRIFGREQARGGAVLSRGDHRIAMAFLTLGLASDGPVTIDDGAVIATSFPDFVGSMQGIGADIG